jgi:peptidoglycan/LPS O-acetylase OafA/YrhL
MNRHAASVDGTGWHKVLRNLTGWQRLQAMDSPGRRLGDLFESGPNALNAIRLGLALSVIVWHSYALAGHDYLPLWAEQLLGYVPVDAFFAISGFLICRAWVRNPRLKRYLLARARRILPGLWVCLLVTAFGIAPLGGWLSGQPPLTLAGQVLFVLGNSSTWLLVHSIDGGPTGVPWPGTWNGSLWSLGHEALCYLGVAGLGVLGLLRRRVLVVLGVAFWTMSAAMVAAGLPMALSHPLAKMPRTGLMFVSGALLWAYRDKIVIDRRVAMVCVALVAVGSLSPNYRLVAAPALAYLMLYAAIALGRHRRLVLRNDLSYGTYVYAFPVQQTCLMVGFPTAWFTFSVISVALTLPLAAVSWFLVERPALRGRWPTLRTRVAGPAGTLPLPARREAAFLERR